MDLDSKLNEFVRIAKGELGQTEGADGYTKYGAFFGAPRADWCIMFIAWCADKAKMITTSASEVCPYVPKVAGTSALRNFYANSNRLLVPIMVSTNPNYPKPGDLVMIRNSGATKDGHAGIVAEVSGNRITTVEGNYSNRVAQVTYTDLVASHGATISLLLSNHVSY